MDLYGIQAARAEGNARTIDNDAYNEAILSARDRITNALNQTKVIAEGNLRGQEGRDTQDKLFYDIHDAISGAGFATSLQRINQASKAYNEAQAANPEGYRIVNFYNSQRSIAQAEQAKLFGSAQAATDKIAQVASQAKSAVTGAVSSADSTRQAVTQALSQRTPTQPQSALERLNQQEAQNRGGLSSISENDDGSPPGAVFLNRNSTNETVASSANTPSVTTTSSTGAADELSNKIMTTGSKITEGLKSGISKGAAGLRVLNDVGGAVGTYEMFKNGFAKNADGTVDRWNEVSDIAGAVGTGLDILGAFIPVLEPVGTLVNTVGAVANTIDQKEKDDAATSQAQSDVTDVVKQRKDQIAALGPLKQSSAPVNSMVSGGLVGTQSQHINNATQGTSTF